MSDLAGQLGAVGMSSSAFFFVIKNHPAEAHLYIMSMILTPLITYLFYLKLLEISNKRYMMGGIAAGFLFFVGSSAIVEAIINPTIFMMYMGYSITVASLLLYRVSIGR